MKNLVAILRSLKGNTGLYFAVFAPEADEVSVIGDFNQWDPGKTQIIRPLGRIGCLGGVSSPD